MPKTLEQRIEATAARLAKLRQRQREQRRKAETRAKIIMGGMLVKLAKTDEEAARVLRKVEESCAERDRQTIREYLGRI